MTKLDAGLITPLPASDSDSGSAAVTDSDMCLRFRWSHDSAFAFVGHVNRLFLIVLPRCPSFFVFFHSFRIVVVIEGADVESLKTLIEILLLYLTTCKVNKNRQKIGDSIWFKALAKTTTAAVWGSHRWAWYFYSVLLNNPITSLSYIEFQLTFKNSVIRK